MHILLLPSFYPSEIRPTTGIFFIDQVEALRSLGHDVGVLIAPRLYETASYIKNNRKLPPLMEAIPSEDKIYRLHSLWVPRVFPLISGKIYEHAALPAYQKYVAIHGQPDIIHAHNIFYGGHMAVKIAERYRVPTVLTEHSTNHLRGRIFLPGQHIIAKATLQNINQSLAVGQVLADKLNQMYSPATRVKTIANVVDTNYFVPKTKNEEFTFAAVGQLNKRKRFDLLVEAFAQAFRDQPVKLIIGGNGSEYTHLESLIQSLNLNSQVTLAGHLSREQVRDLFQQVHVVVSSSDIETFGVTLIEAMSCGNPIIATKSGGPEQFVTEDNGILIPINNKQALSQALQDMYTNYTSYNSQLIRDFCIQNFSQNAIGIQLEDIYRQLEDIYRPLES